MIRYHYNGARTFFARLLQLRGSVFPRCFVVALPCGLLATAFRLLTILQYIPSESDFNLRHPQAWSGFSGLVGFLIVFRTSQAYTRFWSGCTATHQMRAEWFDACSQLMSFCKVSKASKEKVAEFQGKLIRLFSMLHAASLAELEEINHEATCLEDVLAFRYRLIDPTGFDEETLRRLKKCPSKVELLMYWLQMLIVESVDSGVLSITPAILARSFQLMSNGMSAFFDALKITCSPFPFPYAQTCDFLLVIHWCMSPVVIAQWVTHPAFAGAFVFFQCFILWALNEIACQIENPFGSDANDLDGWGMQEEMNLHLLLLVDSESYQMPKLSEEAVRLEGMHGLEAREVVCEMSFMELWRVLADDGEPVPEPARKGQTFSRSSVAQLKVIANASQESGRKSVKAPRCTRIPNMTACAIPSNASRGSRWPKNPDSSPRKAPPNGGTGSGSSLGFVEPQKRGSGTAGTPPGSNFGALDLREATKEHRDANTKDLRDANPRAQRSFGGFASQTSSPRLEVEPEGSCTGARASLSPTPASPGSRQTRI